MHSWNISKVNAKFHCGTTIIMIEPYSTEQVFERDVLYITLEITY